MNNSAIATERRGYPDAAARTVIGIYEKAQLLKKHPRIGYVYDPAAPREIRILLYEHYRITYLIKPSGDIEIMGVFHGALEIDRYFI